MLPATLSIFPLPSVVLFPDVFLPLHVFEPRYRDLVRAALDSDRLIGMVLVRSGAAAAPPLEVFDLAKMDEPAIYPIGCAGVISHVEEVEDGRFNIILRGLQKFRITSEDDDPTRRYRVAHIEPISDPPIDKAALRHERSRLESLLVDSGTENFSFRLPPSMPDVEFVHALSQYFGFEAVERQALLEMPGAVARCRAMIELVEMQLLMGSQGWQGSAH
ncbi:MAG: LON peptidase substrate-binding domain-containing protein [Acidobacteriota bacterium]